MNHLIHVLERITLFTGLLTIVYLGGCSDEATSPGESGESVATTDAGAEEQQSTSSAMTLQEKLNAADIGETVIAEETEYNETIVIPPGVNLEAKEGAELVIQPPTGQPGITCIGSGASTLSHLRVENAGGAGVFIDGCGITLNNVKVQGTIANEELGGSGIVVKNGPSFEANRVSSIDNAGSGLDVKGTPSVVIIHPQFIPVPQELIEGASRVIIHPQFLPEDESSRSIIHPQFTPSDDDGIAIIHPQFSTNTEEYVVIIHPQFMTGSEFSGNGKDGISIIHPQFIGNQQSGYAQIYGIQAENNQNSGISIQDSSLAAISNTVISGNGTEDQKQAGLASINASLITSGTYIAGNAGPGIFLNASAIAVPDQENQQSPRVEEGDTLAIIHPQFLPALTLENNQLGGLVTVDAVQESNQGKADSPAGTGIILNAALIRNNQGEGIDASCSNIAMKNSVVEGSQSRNDQTGGSGIVLDSQGPCEDSAASLVLDKGTLVFNNSGSGIVAKNGSQVNLKGVVANNEKGGILASGVGTNVTIRNLVSCMNGLDQEGCIPPVISNNRLVGISMGESTELVMDSAIVSDSKAKEGEDNNLDNFGDGVLGDKPSSMVITRSKVTNCDRAGLVVIHETLSNGVLPSITVNSSSFENSPYGGVWITPKAAAAKEFTPNILEEIPAFWTQMMATCTTPGAKHSWVELGCMPCMATDCEPGTDGCDSVLPCGECSVNCTAEDEDTCSMDVCLCPEGVECCGQADCAYLDLDPNDCETFTCNDTFACEYVYSCGTNGGTDVGESDEGGEGCETDADCDDDGLECTTNTCVSNTCVFSIEKDACKITNQEGNTFCITSGDTNPVNSCEVCVPLQSQLSYTPMSGPPCDDGLGCTEDTVCLEGICDGGIPHCDDENPCTEDLCSETSQGPVCAVSLTKKEGCCQEDADCNYLEIGCNTGVCIDNQCVEAESSICDDGNPCTTDSCIFDGDTNSTSCGPPQPICEQDDNPCTTSQCVIDGDGGTLTCETIVVDDAPCDDGDECTLDLCEGGSCISSPDLDLCDDGIDCTLDVCEAGTCNAIPKDDLCEEGKACDIELGCVVPGPEDVGVID